MSVEFFNYRVEFQLRGAGHIHGVLWINISEMENSILGITSAFVALRQHQKLSQEQCDVLPSFVDKFTSCSLQNGDDDDVIHIVSEVQFHRHSHSCKKYSTACRIGYPKFPSKTTIIAQPLDKDDFDSEIRCKD